MRICVTATERWSRRPGGGPRLGRAAARVPPDARALAAVRVDGLTIQPTPHNPDCGKPGYADRTPRSRLFAPARPVRIRRRLRPPPDSARMMRAHRCHSCSQSVPRELNEMAERATTTTAGVQRAAWSVLESESARGLPAGVIGLRGRCLGMGFLRCLPAGAGKLPVVRRIASDRFERGPGKAGGSQRLRGSGSSEGRVMRAGRMAGGSSGESAVELNRFAVRRPRKGRRAILEV